MFVASAQAARHAPRTPFPPPSYECQAMPLSLMGHDGMRGIPDADGGDESDDNAGSATGSAQGGDDNISIDGMRSTPGSEGLGSGAASSSFASPASKVSGSRLRALIRSGRKETSATATSSTPPSVSKHVKKELAAAFVQRAPDDHRQWETDLPLVGESLSAPLPSGTFWAGISRMRETLNHYADRVTQLQWGKKFKDQTVRAALGRFVKHEKAIMGNFHLDLQVGYKQVAERVSSLLSVHKVLRFWLDSQDDSVLASVLEPWAAIDKYLVATKQSAAPDLAVVLCFARYHNHFENTESVAESLKQVSVEELEAKLAEVRQAQGEQQEASEDEESADADDKAGAIEAVAKAKAVAKKRRRNVIVDLWAKIRFEQPAIEHLARLLVHGLKTKIYRLGQDFDGDDQTQLNDLLLEVTSLEKFWWAASLKYRSSEPGVEDLASVLGSIAVVFMCCRSCESKRPRTSTVRTASRIVWDAVKSKSVAVADLAKAMRSYRGGKQALARAQSHSASGLQDDAATAAFEAGLDEFENCFSEAFEDLGLWLFRDGETMKRSATEMVLVMQGVRKMGVHLTNCLGRWSAAALHERMETLGIVLGNMVEILQAGNFGLIAIVCQAFRSVFVVDAPLDLSQRAVCQAPDVVASTSADLEVPGADNDTARNLLVAPDVPPAPPINPTSALPIMVAAKNECRVLAKFLSEMSSHLAEFVTALGHRVGPELALKFDEGSSPLDCASEVEDNNAALCDMCEHLELAASIMRYNIEGDSEVNALANNFHYSDFLLLFGKLHFRMGKCNWKLKCSSSVPSGPTIASIESKYKEFHEGYGQLLFDTHCGAFVRSCISMVLDHKVHIALADEKVIKHNKLDGLLPMLLTAPALDDLLPAVRWGVGVAGGEVGIAIEELPYNLALDRLKVFAQAVQMPTIDLPNIANASGNTGIPAQFACTALEAICKLRSLVVTAAILHKELLVLVAANATLDEHSLFDFVPKVLGSYFQQLSEYDSFLSNEESFEVDKNNWSLPPGLAMIRAWRACMSSLGGRCLEAILGQFSKVLSTTCAEVKGVIPDWRATFDSSGLNRSLAKKLLQNKLKPIVLGHNRVHMIMGKMGGAATTLGVTPNLPEHELTSEACAVGLSVLNHAHLASVMVTGVEILEKCEYDPKGHERARDFLAEHMTERTKDIPESFWEELRHLERNAAPTPSPAAKAMAPGTHSVVKPEDGGGAASTVVVKREETEGTTSSTVVAASASSSVEGGATPGERRPKPALKRARLT